MVNVLSENSYTDGNSCQITQELSDGSWREISRHGDEVYKIKTIQKDGSYIITNRDNIKTEELTSDGYLREYNILTQKLKKETSPDKVIKTYYDNGNVETIRDEAKGVYSSYYENGNLARYEDKNYEVYKDITGKVNYELKDGEITINPNWFSYYRLGVKSQTNDEHWEEKCTLNPTKKTLLCLGGDQTREARRANGNINGFVSVMGLSLENISDMQLVACYRPQNDLLRWIWHKVRGFDKQYKNDCKREILQKFMPFMARQIDGKWERLPINELYQNFRNIMIQAHCYGANDLPYYTQVFKETMTKLGYEKPIQQQALKQIICITNNSQRDLTDDLGFTTIHRYSVKDGQTEVEYETKYSDEYPLFMQDNEKFAAQKGNQAAFVETRPNEMIMAFDKILLYASHGEEHNEGFWVTEKLDLTTVGKNQAHLMAKIGLFWYHNHEEIPDITKFIKKITQGSTLHPFVIKAIAFGKKLKAEKKNMLVNHHILKSAWNKFKNPKIEAPKTGVYKLLSDKYRE